MHGLVVGVAEAEEAAVLEGEVAAEVVSEVGEAAAFRVQAVAEGILAPRAEEVEGSVGHLRRWRALRRLLDLVLPHLPSAGPNPHALQTLISHEVLPAAAPINLV